MGHRGSGSRRRLRLIVSVAAATILGTACGIFGNGTRPDAMSAEAHRREAEEIAREAREHREHYNPDARTYLPGPYVGRDYRYHGSDFYWTSRQYNPTAGHLAFAEKSERHAQEHREAARVLETFEEGQCGSFPPETRVVVPPARTRGGRGGRDRRRPGSFRRGRRHERGDRPHALSSGLRPSASESRNGRLSALSARDPDHARRHFSERRSQHLGSRNSGRVARTDPRPPLHPPARLTDKAPSPR